jgi:REP-associated tyrosine transposase
VGSGFSRIAAALDFAERFGMDPRHPQHLKAFSYVGFYRYSLRFCTDYRRQVFTSQSPVDLVRSLILRSATEEQFAVIAYCFMPDHLHLLVEGQAEDSDCKRFIARSKQYSGFYYTRQFGTRLWQRYGFERVLRDNEQTFVIARYILENPVRAGLVAAIEEYPFVGSFVYTLPELMTSAYASNQQSG